MLAAASTREEGNVERRTRDSEAGGGDVRLQDEQIDLSTREASDEQGGVREFRRRLLAFGFGIVTLSIIALLVAIYLQLIYQLLWGVALAILFYPLHRKILRLVHGRTSLAATISTALSIAIVIVPAALLVFNLVAEVQDLWPRIENVVGDNAYQQVSEWLEDSPLRSVVHWALGPQAGTGPEVLEEEVRKAALSLQVFLLEQLRKITRSVPAFLIKLGITLVTFFFFLKNGPGWSKQAQRGLPLAQEHSARLFRIAEQTINAVFRGVVLTAATQAALGGLGYWVAGAEVPILLALVTFIAALIPFVGPVFVWLPVSIGLLLTGKTWAAIGLAVWGTCVVSLVDNVLRPWLIGREIQLPLLWLFLAIVGGLKLFGFLGVLVGPAALSLAVACFRIYMEARREDHHEERQPAEENPAAP